MNRKQMDVVRRALVNWYWSPCLNDNERQEVKAILDNITAILTHVRPRQTKSVKLLKRSLTKR